MSRILKFSMGTCAPCHALSSLIESNKELFSRRAVEEVLYEEELDTFIKYKVRAVPTIVLIDDEGNELDRKDKCSWADLVKMANKE